MQYIIGLARNTRLQARVKLAEQVLERDYRRTGSKQRLVSQFIYAAPPPGIDRDAYSPVWNTGPRA